MKKILVICGPTATGKTKLAISLAKKYGGEIVAADSRQVYVGLDIGTGKDVVRENKKDDHYEVEGICIWGYDLVSPKEEFSVAQYVTYAVDKINEIISRGRLPILVGGTGLYIKGVIDGIPTMSIPKNEGLRRSLEGKSAEEIFENLAKLDPIKAASMNASDSKNSRRIIRAIEIAQFKLEGGEADVIEGLKDSEPLFVGLTAPKEVLAKKIHSRIVRRVEMGLEIEIENLIASGVNWTNQSMSSLGYKEWKDYFEGGKANRVKVLPIWENGEIKYSKRQLTWFKADQRIHWFDITDPESKENIDKLVHDWYTIS